MSNREIGWLYPEYERPTATEITLDDINEAKRYMETGKWRNRNRIVTYGGKPMPAIRAFTFMVNKLRLR